jgi:hypothetical protein
MRLLFSRKQIASVHETYERCLLKNTYRPFGMPWLPWGLPGIGSSGRRPGRQGQGRP